ncbi:UNVERIFIED_ORG: hypothetical protein M2438_001691 [Methylobacterium sp. SuP10 SLI 274]|nr:hypothetical protein [Methylobacterium sp. SuP10 SLI 274]
MPSTTTAGEERGDRDHVGPGAQVQELARGGAADAEAGGKIEQHAYAQHQVAGDDPGHQRQERGDHDEGDRCHVEHEQGVAEAVRPSGLALVQIVYRCGQSCHGSPA